MTAVQLIKIPTVVVSDQSGMSVSSIFVSKTDQQNYLHASMCHDVQKII